MSDCLFCKIAAGEIPSNKVYEDESVLAFRDINPQAPVHVLIVPKKHMRNILECDDATATAVLNGANEAAVGLFLERKIGFMDIPRLVERALEQVSPVYGGGLAEILDADRAARAAVLSAATQR